MDSLPVGIWVQYPVLLITLSILFAMIREFNNILKDNREDWQQFLVSYTSRDNTTLENLVLQITRLTNELVQLRRDFDIAVTAMRERTNKHE